MLRNVHPLLESLEDRSFLSTVHAAASSSILDEFLTFGPTTLVSQQSTSVTLTLHRQSLTTIGSGISYSFNSDGPVNNTLQVQVVTGPAGGTTDPSAIVGEQYQAINETVTFPPGVRNESVTIPIVAGAPNPGHLEFSVTATPISGTGSDYSDPVSATVTLAENINATIPRILSSHLIVQGRNASGMVIRFNEAMNPASVENLAAYDITDVTTHYKNPSGLLDFLVPSFRGTQPDLPVQTKSATYNASNNTVTLLFKHPVGTRDTYQVDSGTPVEDTSGTLINDDGRGMAGQFSIDVTTKPSKPLSNF